MSNPQVPWIKTQDARPARPGIYRTAASWPRETYNVSIYYSYWDGQRWYERRGSVRLALESYQKGRIPLNPPVAWKGRALPTVQPSRQAVARHFMENRT